MIDIDHQLLCVSKKPCQKQVNRDGIVGSLDHLHTIKS